jgi:hypothetical protein
MRNLSRVAPLAAVKGGRRMRSDLARRMVAWWAGVLCLLLLVLPLHPGPTFAAKKGATLQQRLESAKVVREFSTEGAKVRGFKTAKDCVAFVLDEADSSVAVVYGLDGTRRFRLAAWNGRPEDSIFRGLSIATPSDDGSTLAICEIMGYEDGKWEMYDATSGSLLFESDDEAQLIPSPHGQYFCKLYDGVSYEPLAIYDRQGRMVKRFDAPIEWRSLFLDDEHLAVVDRDTLRIIETATGDVLNAVALHLARIPAFEGYGAEFGTLPLLAVSGVHSAIAVYDGHTLVVYSGGGDELWRQVFEDRLCAVSFDDSLPRMALQFRDWGATYGYFKVMPIRNSQVAFESVRIPALANSDPVSVFHAMWFAGGVIAVWRPLAAMPDGLDDSEHSTIFLEVNEAELTLSAPATRPGLYRPVGRYSDAAAFVRADNHGDAVLVTVRIADQYQEGR